MTCQKAEQLKLKGTRIGWVQMAVAETDIMALEHDSQGIWRFLLLNFSSLLRQFKTTSNVSVVLDILIDSSYIA